MEGVDRDILQQHPAVKGALSRTCNHLFDRLDFLTLNYDHPHEG